MTAFPPTKPRGKQRVLRVAGLGMMMGVAQHHSHVEVFSFGIIVAVVRLSDRDGMGMAVLWRPPTR